MSNRVLLCMDDGMASIFKQFMSGNSENFSIVNSISLIHSLRQSISRYKPDIVYIALDRVHYDTKNHKEEILSAIYDIKIDPQYSRLRFAVQSSLPANDPFLKKLASRGVYDIFNLQNGRLDMNRMMDQLSQPANMSNVARYLSIKENSKKHPAKPRQGAGRKNSPIAKPIERKKVLNKKPDKIVKPKESNTRSLERAPVPPREKKRRSESKPRKKTIKRRRTHRSKKIFVILLLVIMLIGGILVTLKSCGNAKVQKQSYSTMMKQGDYAEAAASYPDRATQIENRMLNDPDVSDKASINSEIVQYSNADPVKFDNAYFTGNFKKVIKIYKNTTDNDLITMNKSRKTMLAFAYLKTGKVNSAKKIAAKLNNKQLDQKIDAYTKFKESNDKLEEKIKSGQLNKEDQKKAKQQIKNNKESMENL